MSKLVTALLCAFAFCVGGVTGQLMEQSKTQRARALVKEAQDSADRPVQIAKEAQASAAKAQEITDECFENAAMLLDIVFDLPIEQVQEIRRTMVKPTL